MASDPAAPVAWPVAVFRPEPLMLWSATNQVVHYICTHFFPNYYVWCSPVFDGKAAGRYARGHGQPPSSDPVRIYRSLLDAAQDGDEHNSDYLRQKNKLQDVALALLSTGEIDDVAAQEVVTYLKAANVREWKPVIYAIPYAGVKGRVLAVPRDQRASGKPEYVIPDLKITEFEPIEPMQCA